MADFSGFGSRAAASLVWNDSFSFSEEFVAATMSVTQAPKQTAVKAFRGNLRGVHRSTPQ
jgi:hypothetical protein